MQPSLHTTRGVPDAAPSRSKLAWIGEVCSVEVLKGSTVTVGAGQVAKKAFEAVASRSLKSISEILGERFRGDTEVPSTVIHRDEALRSVELRCRR